MIRLLVSVRDASEAAAAIAGGADIIDVKEPANGPLGMAPPEVIAEIVRLARGRRPVSAALGELTERNTIPEVNYFKIGLARAPADWWMLLPRDERFVAVAYADAARVDAPPIKRVIDWAIDHRAAGMLIDTAVKDGRGLLDWCESMLPECIERMRTAGLFIALAGSLTERTLPRVLDLSPDIVAVRGAACVGSSRTGAIDASRVAALKQLIESHAGRPAACAG